MIRLQGASGVRGKLLNVNNYHYRRGGSDVVYLEHAKLFESEGWSNAFFSMHHPKNISSEWSSYFVDEIEFGSEYSLLQKLSRASKVIYSFEAQKKLMSLLDKFRPDVAHLHCIYHHLSPSILPILRSHGVATVMTAHDLKIACPAYKMLNSGGICERCNGGSVLNVVRHRCVRDSLGASLLVAFESSLQRIMGTYAKNVDKFVTPSRFFLEKFVEWGWEKNQFEYIPNYVDSDDFVPHYVPGDYFIYFGRLAPEKGVATLLRAAARLGIDLKVVGTGPEEANLKALAGELGLSEAIFLGFKSGDELRQLIGNARAVVLPSEWYENAPMSVLESLALGKPVIGARIGGIPELVVEGVGWTFESGSVDALAGVLDETSRLDDRVVADIGKAGRDFVARTFNRQRYVDEMSNLYGSLRGVRS